MYKELEKTHNTVGNTTAKIGYFKCINKQLKLNVYISLNTLFKQLDQLIYLFVLMYF